ncbi:hypothetical protein FYK55_02600 [Roseiconus nitratireducens]|uniref:Uncharacterized protein n=1 Tax=Roseiconus nitratireducens TaxID=2605748 RepID=A0A5M6DIB8_9BACT|nr:hypothetical protein [Roseiconus nitratireducens]KAA5547304.1 hypothetical protein FYK55_02600 [Roseiconus nitratireducens]
MGPPSTRRGSIRDCGRIDEKKLREISGCAASRLVADVLWVHNDGDAECVYAIRPDGDTLARLVLPVQPDDVEDIATVGQRGSRPPMLYLADIGDNDCERDCVTLLRTPEPSLSQDDPDDEPKTILADYLECISVVYPDRAHDAETLLVDPVDGGIYIVTKADEGALVYQVPLNESDIPTGDPMRWVTSLSVSPISAGDISADGTHILLRSEDCGWLWRRRRGSTLAATLAEPPRCVAVRGKKQARNGEAIGFTADGKGYWTISEGKRERLCLFPLDPPISP